MTPGPRLRTGAATALLLALGLALSGCADDRAADSPEPTPASGTPTAPTPKDTDPKDTAPKDTDPKDTGAAVHRTTGMDVQKLNSDGSVTTIEVRDFPR